MIADRSPRTLRLLAAAALLVGGLLHTLDQALYARAGPLPLLLTAPVVATLSYLSAREATRRRVFLLVAWGFVGSGVAVLLVYLAVAGHVLPRAMTESEMALYDAGMFLWFVLALAAAYVVAARRRPRETTVAVLLAPVAQSAYGLLLRALVALGLYA